MASQRVEPPLTRHTLMQICETPFLDGIKLNFLSATEAILFCRGPGLEGSESYDHNRLIKWLVDNKKILQQAALRSSRNQVN